MDGIPTLVDATNGNIPFLFLVGESAEKLLGYEDKPSVKVRMVEAEEDYYYHRGGAGHTAEPVFRNGGVADGHGPGAGF